LDNNQIIEQFEKIEKKLVKLIDIRAALEAEIKELNDYIGQLEQELQEKIEIENKFIEERSFVKSKVDSLLNKLENIDIQDADQSQRIEEEGASDS
jgi:hypothetical protein